MKIHIRPKTIYSIIWALVLITPVYMIEFAALFEISRNIVLYVLTLIIIILFVIGSFSGYHFQNYKIVLLIGILESILFILSIGQINAVDYSLVQFGFYFLVPFFLILQKCDFAKILKYLIYFSFPLFLGINQVLVITNYGLYQADMYNTYAFLPCIVAAFSHFFYYREKSNLLTKIGYLLNIYYLFRVSLTAVRGFWLVIIIFFGLKMIHYMQIKTTKKSYRIILLLGLLSLILIVANLEQVLVSIISILERSINIEIGILDKMSKLIVEGDIWNGRIEIWKISLECFLDNPIWGQGINGIQLWTKGAIEYPHNFILQLLNDGGIIFGLLPICVIIYGIILFITNGSRRNSDIINFFIFIISISVPVAMLSGNVWQTASLWLAIFFCAKYIIVTREEQNE